VEPPLARRTVVAHGGDPIRICIGDQARAEISCRDREGEWVTIRWEAEPLPITEAEIEAWRERLAQAYAPKLSREQVLEVLDQVPVPKFRPPFSRIFLDPEGDLWVEKGPGPGDLAIFLVFDPEGALLGRVEVPPVRVLGIGKDYVLGVYEDEVGVQYLQVYELLRPPG
jgi:hypothetical protein